MFSSRIKKIVELGKYRLDSSTESSVPFAECSFGKIWGRLDSGNRIIEIKYDPSGHQIESLGIFEAICTICDNQNLKRLLLLEYRELESFLRDTNSEPAFENHEIWKEFFEEIKLVFAECLILGCLDNSNLSDSSFINGDIFTRTKLVESVLKGIQETLKHSLGLEIVLYEVDGLDIVLGFNGHDFGIISPLRSALGRVFSKSLKNLDINIVAQ